MKTDKKWKVEISASRKWYELNIKEVIEYRDLIFLFVKRSFNAQYKQTVLGPLWFILNPLMTTFVSTLIFGNIAKIQSDGVPYFLFYLVGYTLWNYFSTCVSTTSTTFITNAPIMGKVYFPRLTMPIASVLFAGINMIVIFILSIISMGIYAISGTSFHITPIILIVPVLMIQTAVLGLSVGIIISSLTTKYRDLAILVSFGLNLWMYLTPVVYPISEIPSKIRVAIMLNPMSAIVQNYKYALLGVGSFEGGYWIVSALGTFIFFLIGILLFNSVEKTFMDTV
ncbi:ABC transporter permease [Butyrivibrio fibrisolvens]|uniref:ABC transporter permease n=1 Tax=Butyrivibrio fibrisolvens TaxID=831 RepID=UPI0003B3C978|nr:ABC transporter permease [Butyrivibrio fibrisolvens]